MDSEKKREREGDAIIRKKDADASISDWAPGQSFARADFPAAGKKGGGKTPPPGSRGNPSDHSYPNNPSRVGQRDIPAPARQRAGGSNPSPGRSEKSESSAGASSQGGLHAWNPRHVDGRGADVHRVTTEKRSLGGGDSGGEGGGGTILPPTSGESRGEIRSALLPPGILREAVLKNRENTLHLLRRWYWEKEGRSGASGMQSIRPRARIYIVLNSLGDTLLQHMMEIMSPMERRQFQEILKEGPEVSSDMINRVRMEFPALLKMQGEQS